MVNTGRIVERPLKVDFHIHSAMSSHKDGQKVKGCTPENIDILMTRLESNKVNMIAITDHDAFDFNLYDILRTRATSSEHLLRVFPGVEFTVCFDTEKGEKHVHIVTLFNDANSEQVKTIGEVLALKNGRPNYDRGSAFSEKEYWSIIHEIGLDIIAIAHQKESPSSKYPRANDASGVGSKLFNEFLFMEYFEAYEYKSRRHELFNKHYAYSKDQMERLRFITGSDCHDWSVYPAYEPGKADDLSYSYLKCLPTFKGLAMAVTDNSRIKTVPSFFSGSTKVLPSINVSLEGVEYSIPLSPGINAIIGDNSIGKSSLLNALVGYEGITTTVEKGQERYLASKNVVMRSSLSSDQILQYDGQDSIRKNFEGLTRGKAKNELLRHFPEDIDSMPFRNFAMGQFELYFKALGKSIVHQEALRSLFDVSLPALPLLEAPESISYNKDIKLEDITPHNKLIEAVSGLTVQLGNLLTLHEDAVFEEDRKDVEISIAALERIKTRHDAVVNRGKLESLIANKINDAISEQENVQSQIITDAQKAQNAFLLSIESVASAVAEAVRSEHALREFSFDFEELEIVPKTNPVGNLLFVSKLSTHSISVKLLRDIVDKVTKANAVLDTLLSDSDDIRSAIKNYPDDEDDPIAVLRDKIELQVDSCLQQGKSIIREKDDVFDELSRGYNAQMYFALMADRGVGEGIYIVDQPEDQISQKAIKESVLGEFREIASARQVILVTHNPQFIVNLDVDNVVFIGQKDNGLYIRSGALEYESPEYSILEVVAENIDGGLDTIRKRMKRYEKAN